MRDSCGSGNGVNAERMKRRPRGRARALPHGGGYESADAGIELAPRILGTPEPGKATKPGEGGMGRRGGTKT